MGKPATMTFFALLLLVPVAWGAPQQSHAGIREAAAGFLLAQARGLPGQATITVGEIDRRIALPHCPVLEPFLPSGARLLGNTTVGVRCPGAKGWTLFVPAHVRVAAGLLIAARPLQQGQVLRQEDLAIRSGELSQPGELTDAAQATGMVLKFGIGAGQTLKQDMVRAPFAVTQGQTVQLQVEGEGYRILAEGQALSNAAEGQSLRVKAHSGQVVSGLAQADGSVAVHP
jgi:flagella basal body P-ring formation protein FlgA